MPLLVYMGQTSFRSEGALTHREDNMIFRGWGPRDPMRLAHMMAIGHARDTRGIGVASAKGAGKSKCKGKGKGTAGKP